jgi:glycosyltransferase involved in cell wall biosynthesis
MELRMNVLSKTMKLVAIVPTLNRPDDITRLIESVNNIMLSDRCDFSLIVVDNSLDGNIKSLMLSLECKFVVTYIHEPLKGLSNARNAGLKAITSYVDYVCTIDDDIVLPDRYLLDVLEVIQQDPKAGLIGSRVELYNKQDLPMTIKTNPEKAYFGKGSYVFGFIHGCSMVFSYDAMKQVGLFDQALGAGTKSGGAEDSDYYYRIWLNNKAVIYNPKWYVYHNHGRRLEAERIKLYSNYTIGQGAFYGKYILKKRSQHAIKLFYWGVKSDYASKKVNMLTKFHLLIKGAYLYLRS